MVVFLTSRKFQYASLTVDDRSDYTFSHHQESTISEETIIGKLAYESYLRKHVKEVTRCHADNVTHAVVRNKEEIENKKHTLTFCGIGNHHQNRKTENRIKIIFNPTRSMLIHADHRWPEVVTPSL